MKEEVKPEEISKSSLTIKPKQVREQRVKNQTTPKVRKPRKPRQSSLALGAKAAARIKSKRLAKDVVGSKISNPLLKVCALAAVGALASYFINKQ